MCRYIYSMRCITMHIMLWIVACGCALPSPSLRLSDNAPDTRREILAAIPPGTPIDRAAAIMRSNGFKCEPMRKADFLDRRGIDYLYCDRERAVGLMVGRRWQVALVEEKGRVMDVLVGTGLIGP